MGKRLASCVARSDLRSLGGKKNSLSERSGVKRRRPRAVTLDLNGVRTWSIPATPFQGCGKTQGLQVVLSPLGLESRLRRC